MGRNKEKRFDDFEEKTKFSDKKKRKGAHGETMKDMGIQMAEENESLEEKVIEKMSDVGNGIKQNLENGNKEMAGKILEEFKKKFGAVESVQNFIVGQEAIIESAKEEKGGVGEEKGGKDKEGERKGEEKVEEEEKRGEANPLPSVDELQQEIKYVKGKEDREVVEGEGNEDKSEIFEFPKDLRNKLDRGEKPTEEEIEFILSGGEEIAENETEKNVGKGEVSIKEQEQSGKNVSGDEAKGISAEGLEIDKLKNDEYLKLLKKALGKKVKEILSEANIKEAGTKDQSERGDKGANDLTEMQRDALERSLFYLEQSLNGKDFAQEEAILADSQKKLRAIPDKVVRKLVSEKISEREKRLKEDKEKTLDKAKNEAIKKQETPTSPEEAIAVDQSGLNKKEPQESPKNLEESGAQKEVASTHDTEKGRVGCEEVAEGTNKELGQENREERKSSEEQQKEIEGIVAAVLEESRGAGSPEEAVAILGKFKQGEVFKNIDDLEVKQGVVVAIDAELDSLGEKTENLSRFAGGGIVRDLNREEKKFITYADSVKFLKGERVKYEDDYSPRGDVVRKFIDRRLKKIEKEIMEKLIFVVDNYIGENDFSKAGRTVDETEKAMEDDGLLSEENKAVIFELNSRIKEGINKSAEKIINELEGKVATDERKIISLKLFSKSEEFNKLDVFLRLDLEKKLNIRIGELREQIKRKVVEQLQELKEEWESGNISGKEYESKLKMGIGNYKEMEEYEISILFNEQFNNDLNSLKIIGDIYNSFDEALKDNDFEEARYVKDGLKRKYDQDLYAGDIEHGIVVYFERKLDDVEKKVMRIAKLNESGNYVCDPRDKEELDNLVEEKKRLKEGFEEFCFDEIKSGVEIQDLKQEAGGWGNENKDMKKIVEELENKLKFIDPEEVKKYFGKELEAMIIGDRTKRGDIAKMGELLGLKIDISSKKWTEEEKVLAKVTEILKGAQEWAKIAEYDKKQQTASKSRKQRAWDLTKETFGSLVKGAAAFKVAGAGLAFAGGTPIGLAGVSATFLTAGGAMVGWRYIEGFLREEAKKREVNKINLDYSQDDVREKLMDNMANLISMEQADKLNPRKKKREKEEKKIISEYAQIDDDKKAEEYLKNIRDGKNKKKGFFREIFSEPILKESKDKKEREAAIGMAAFSSAKFRTDAKAARFMHKMVENNPNLKEKFLKEGKLAKIGRFAKGAGIEYAKELGGFAAYELIPFFKVGAVVGMAKKGAELPDIVFSNREFYEKNEKIKKAMKIGCGIASGLAFAALMAPRTAEGGIIKGWVEGVKEDAGILGSLGKGKYGIGAAAGKIATGFKARHGIKESKSAEQLAQEQDIDNRFWKKMSSIEKKISTDEKDIGMMKILLKNIKGEDGKVGDLSMEDKVAFLDSIPKSKSYLDRISKSESEASVETWKRWDKLDNELDNKVLSDSKQFTPEELKAEAEWRLDKRIRKLDGDESYPQSVKDIQEYLKESTSERLVKEVKQEIAAEAELVKKGETVKKVETGERGKAETVEKGKMGKMVERVEKGKKVERVERVEMGKMGKKVEETGTINGEKVKEGDTVWKIAKEMEKDLGIQRPKEPNGLKGKDLEKWQKAQDTYFNDAIKDEIAKQMRAKGSNPHNIKEGQELLIDKAEIKAGLERRGIVEKAGKLTTGDVDNILENNANLRKKSATAARELDKRGRKVEMGKREEVKTVEKAGIERNEIREIEGRLKEAGFNKLEDRQVRLLSEVINENGVEAGEIAAAVEKSGEIISKLNNRSIDQKAAIRELLEKTTKELKSTKTKLIKRDIIREVERKEVNPLQSGMEDFAKKLHLKPGEYEILEIKGGKEGIMRTGIGTKNSSDDDYDFIFSSSCKLIEVRKGELEWHARSIQGETFLNMKKEIISKKQKAGVEPYEIFDFIQKKRIGELKGRMETVLGKKEDLDLLDTPKNAKVVEALTREGSLKLDQPNKTVADCFRLCNKYDGMIKGFSLRKRSAFAKAMIGPENKQNGADFIKEWFGLNVDAKDKNFNLFVKGGELELVGVPIKNRRESIILNKEGIKSGKGWLKRFNKAFTNVGDFLSHLEALYQIDERNKFRGDF